MVRRLSYSCGKAVCSFISADKLVLATGSPPQRPALNIPYWTSDDIFELHKMPESITIVGGGYIACELGHFFGGIGRI
jgi:pyruvate/2-oxoglutarate dehydrogenase complex dihydrolipoamide dehydrogenase (E3) component